MSEEEKQRLEELSAEVRELKSQLGVIQQKDDTIGWPMFAAGLLTPIAVLVIARFLLV